MRQSFLVPCLPGYLRAIPHPLPLSSLSFRCHSGPLTFATLCGNPSDAASYQSAESVNRRGNVFQPASTLPPTRIVSRRAAILVISYSSPYVLVLLVFCSFRTSMGLDHPRSDCAQSKFNGIDAQSRSPTISFNLIAFPVIRVTLREAARYCRVIVFAVVHNCFPLHPKRISRLDAFLSSSSTSSRI